MPSANKLMKIIWDYLKFDIPQLVTRHSMIVLPSFSQSKNQSTRPGKLNKYFVCCRLLKMQHHISLKFNLTPRIHLNNVTDFYSLIPIQPFKSTYEIVLLIIPEKQLNYVEILKIPGNEGIDVPSELIAIGVGKIKQQVGVFCEL